MTPMDEAIDGLYEAAARPERWQDAVGRVAGLFHAATAVLYLERSCADRFRLLDPSVVFGHSPAAIASYADYYGGVNPFNLYATESHLGVLTESFLEERTAFGRRFTQSEYFYDWVRPQNIRHVAGRRLRLIGDTILTVAFWRPEDAGVYREEEIDALERISRHIDRTLDIGARLQTAQAEIEALMGRTRAAVLTLGLDGRVRQASAAADALLAAGTALRSEAGRLRTAIVQDQAALDRLIACAIRPSSLAWAENARLPLRRNDGGAPLTVSAVGVAHRFESFLPDRSAAVILTVEGFEEEARDERLRLRFGLSRAEARVAKQVMAGRSPAEAAAALGLSVETVRSHLKHIYARTGTRRQSELALLLQRDRER